MYYLFTEQPSLPSLSSQSSISAEPAVFKTTEFFSTLTDQGSVFKTTFDQVTTESFTQDKSGNIPEFSTSISSKQIPSLGNQNLQGFETNFKSVEPTSSFGGFESTKTKEFGGFESADSMPKVELL